MLAVHTRNYHEEGEERACWSARGSRAASVTRELLDLPPRGSTVDALEPVRAARQNRQHLEQVVLTPHRLTELVP